MPCPAAPACRRSRSSAIPSCVARAGGAARAWRLHDLLRAPFTPASGRIVSRRRKDGADGSRARRSERAAAALPQGPPPGFRSGFVAVLGRPNVGKSTLVNALVGQKVSIVSDRPQTTRRRIAGVVDAPAFQLVLLDLPGLPEAVRRAHRSACSAPSTRRSRRSTPRWWCSTRRRRWAAATASSSPPPPPRPRPWSWRSTRSTWCTAGGCRARSQRPRRSPRRPRCIR